MPPVLHRQAEAGRLRGPGGALPAPVRRAQEADLGGGGIDRSQLLAAKLRALVTDAFGPLTAEEETFPGGAARRAGNRAWILAEERAGRALGPVLAWARAHDVDELHLLAETDTGVLARRAGELRQPPQIWRVIGRSLTAAEPDPPPPPAVALDPRAEPFRALLAAAGVDVVIEYGVLVGEIAGLEVARVMVDGDGARLELGVGRHDRLAHSLVHGDVPLPEALAGVIEEVRRHRRPGAAPHPLGRLAPERHLRARLVADPALVGATTLAPVDPPRPRQDLLEPAPAPALGEQPGGEAVVVVCSAGVDLDLVPAAADARLVHAPGARLVLAVPERDVHPVTGDLAGLLRRPAEVVGIPSP